MPDRNCIIKKNALLENKSLSSSSLSLCSWSPCIQCMLSLSFFLFVHLSFPSLLFCSPFGSSFSRYLFHLPYIDLGDGSKERNYIPRRGRKFHLFIALNFGLMNFLYCGCGFFILQLDSTQKAVFVWLQLRHLCIPLSFLGG